MYMTKKMLAHAPTCPADASAAVDHDGWASQVPPPVTTHLLHSGCLVTPHFLSELQHGQGGARCAEVWPASELEVSYPPSLARLQGNKTNPNMIDMN